MSEQEEKDTVEAVAQPNKNQGATRVNKGWANLIPPPKKGEVRNPKGRPPKDVSLTSLLKEEIDKICPADKEGRTWRQLLVLATMRLAMQGKEVALKEVWQRLDGRVAQQIDLNANVRRIEDDLADIDTRGFELRRIEPVAQDRAVEAESSPVH